MRYERFEGITERGTPRPAFRTPGERWAEAVACVGALALTAAIRGATHGHPAWTAASALLPPAALGAAAWAIRRRARRRASTWV
jgi:hypothetical protein